MRKVLSAAGRAFLRAFVVTFAALATGILAAPDLNQAYALAGAAVLASLDAAFGAVRVFVPQLKFTGYPEVFTTALQTAVAGFITLAIGVLAAPDIGAGKAALVAGLLAIGTALLRVVQGYLTPREIPVPGAGFDTPAPA